MKKFISILIIFVMMSSNLAYADTGRMPTRNIQPIISGVFEAVVLGYYDAYQGHCMGLAQNDEKMKIYIFKNRSEQELGIAQVAMSSVTVVPVYTKVDSLGTRFKASCYVAKAQHSMNGIDYYKMEIDFSAIYMLFNGFGHRKLTKIHSRTLTPVAVKNVPYQVKKTLAGEMSKLISAKYNVMIEGSNEFERGSLADLADRRIMELRRCETLTIQENEITKKSIGVMFESDESRSYWEQYNDVAITFVKPRNNTHWKDYTKYKSLKATLKDVSADVNYTYTLKSGKKKSGIITAGSETWEITSIDLTKPVIFDGKFVISDFILE